MGSHQPIRKIVTPEIPDKLYFRIGDVAKLCEVPAYVLRFWETEFPQLKPNKGGTGQRLYRKRDVEMALRIKSLLYDQGYTIPGARQVFKAEVKPGAPEPTLAEVPQPAAQAQQAHVPVSELHRGTQLQSIHNELTALLGLLSRPVSTASHIPETSSKVKAMRPRLVIERSEPRPIPVPTERPKLRLEQRGLFGEELPEPVDLSE
jgi:DNA-binding transcriptional MerR regulator